MDSNHTKLSHSIKGIFNHQDILTLARKVGFTSRLRTLHPANLVAAMIQSLGCMKQANLADVLRTLNAKFQDMDNYKPFHNQLKKQSLTALLKSLTEKASKNLLLEPFKAALPSHYPFKHIHLHDGSSLT